MVETQETPIKVEDTSNRKSPETVHSDDEPSRPSLAANRPASVASTQSNTSSGAPRTTTTSRRGGRTRSRSPPTMTNHPTYLTEQPFHRLESLEQQSGRSTPKSPRNPSSAAAAAAAAAKALSTGGRNSSSWGHENVGETAPQRSDHRGDTRYHGYDDTFGGSTSWPGEEDAARRSGYARDHTQMPGDRQGYSRRSQYDSQDNPGSGNQSGPYSERGRHHNDQYGVPYGRGYDERYRGSRDRESYDLEHSRGRGRSSPPTGSGGHYAERHPRYDSHGEPYFGELGGIPPTNNSIKTREKGNHYGEVFSPQGSSGAREVITPSTQKRAGGTTRVIGTATPIHVPRAVDPPRQFSSHGPSVGTPASVFRGRPDGDGHGRQHEEDSPQKILLSLRTPTTSFDEREIPTKQKGIPSKTTHVSSKGAPPMSPEEPPQIHNSHNQPHMDHNIFFERTSPDDRGTGKEHGTLEMAPSFSLFNQSFDSLGDAAQYLNVGGPLDAAFHSNSFGAALAASSGDNTENPQFMSNSLERGFSTVGSMGNERSASILFNSSGGALAFGMSPVNSFGNGAPSSGSNMMILGGSDTQATSPTQMLSIYPPYSGGYSHSSGQQAPFRSRGNGEHPSRSMSSGGSFGGNTYNRSFHEGSPQIAYHGHTGHNGSRSQDGSTPGFYSFLCKNKDAFLKCSFLLPGLKAALLESPVTDPKKCSGDGDRSKKSVPSRRIRYPLPSLQDTSIAIRRVACAICAFGGSVSGDRAIISSSDSKAKENSANSIFREKDGGNKSSSATTVTPTSSTGSPASAREQNRDKIKYDEMLPSRYYENENRLSWEFEELPPVGCFSEDEEDARARSKKVEEMGVKNEEDDDEDDDDDDRMGSPLPLKNGSLSEHGTKTENHPSGSDQPKMRYRCKLCGQPKQNHTCPYQQSLQRSIGIQIYPAVNAFTSNEPGLLAPALTEMNNFISSGCDSISSTDSSPSRPTPDRQASVPTTSTPSSNSGPTNVTPETMRSSTGNSPGSSSLSTGSGGSPLRTPFRTPSLKRKRSSSAHTVGVTASQRVGSPPGTSGRKRHQSQVAAGSDDNSDMLFVEAIDLKPEQFRIITPSKKSFLPDAYTYPSLPLPYAQRKRLSDNLFSLSKEIPQLTDECAVVLRKAREKDMWDLAVAELMTQVVVVIHCADGDGRFEGLRHYLLTLGVAC